MNLTDGGFLSDFTKCYRVLPSFNGFYRVLTWFYLVSLDLHSWIGFYLSNVATLVKWNLFISDFAWLSWHSIIFYWSRWSFYWNLTWLESLVGFFLITVRSLFSSIWTRRDSLGFTGFPPSTEWRRQKVVDGRRSIFHRWLIDFPRSLQSGRVALTNSHAPNQVPTWFHFPTYHPEQPRSQPSRTKSNPVKPSNNPVKPRKTQSNPVKLAKTQ